MTRKNRNPRKKTKDSGEVPEAGAKMLVTDGIIVYSFVTIK